MYMFSIHTIIYIYLQQYVQKLEGYLQLNSSDPYTKCYKIPTKAHNIQQRTVYAHGYIYKVNPVISMFCHSFCRLFDSIVSLGYNIVKHSDANSS